MERHPVESTQFPKRSFTNLMTRSTAHDRSTSARLLVELALPTLHCPSSGRPMLQPRSGCLRSTLDGSTDDARAEQSLGTTTRMAVAAVQRAPVTMVWPTPIAAWDEGSMNCPGASTGDPGFQNLRHDARLPGEVGVEGEPRVHLALFAVAPFRKPDFAALLAGLSGLRVVTVVT